MRERMGQTAATRFGGDERIQIVVSRDRNTADQAFSLHSAAVHETVECGVTAETVTRRGGREK